MAKLRNDLNIEYILGNTNTQRQKMKFQYL